ncbi:MAG: HU family DNA-binding protein [bacterium]|nr:HU family DNA-binding protein [bacterium]
MNKAQLAEVVAAKIGLSKRQAEDTINLIFGTITDVLRSDDEVTITGFGAFSTRVRKGRTGVNPRNPVQRIQIAPVRVAKFRAGKTLKDALRSTPSERASRHAAPEPAELPDEPPASTPPPATL